MYRRLREFFNVIWRNLGHCSYCMRKALLSAVAAWVIFGAAATTLSGPALLGLLFLRPL